MDTTGLPGGEEWAWAVGRELMLPVIPAALAADVDLAALVEGCPAGAVVAGPLSTPELAPLVPVLRAALPGALPAGTGTDVEADEAWDARSVTRAALRLRAAARTGR